MCSRFVLIFELVEQQRCAHVYTTSAPPPPLVWNASMHHGGGVNSFPVLPRWFTETIYDLWHGIDPIPLCLRF